MAGCREDAHFAERRRQALVGNRSQLGVLRDQPLGAVQASIDALYDTAVEKVDEQLERASRIEARLVQGDLQLEFTQLRAHDLVEEQVQRNASEVRARERAEAEAAQLRGELQAEAHLLREERPAPPQLTMKHNVFFQPEQKQPFNAAAIATAGAGPIPVSPAGKAEQPAAMSRRGRPVEGQQKGSARHAEPAAALTSTRSIDDIRAVAQDELKQRKAVYQACGSTLCVQLATALHHHVAAASGAKAEFQGHADTPTAKDAATATLQQGVPDPFSEVEDCRAGTHTGKCTR
eukprot:TRINITY_DN3290_c0_g2_i3.p1 TRINITY_DN3290_c0_g2~~TRINITY_DN3290_c0_g2_i3.p1  ORF type:complete len:328 (+),score=107.38 TRINITY_DN3290_c0_g2_i3:112-984(+)